MTAKQYVNDVGSFLQCSLLKKKEIKKQLLSDINSAVEKGESLDEVLDRMGIAWEIAIKYNDNFSKAEKKTAKREKRLKIWVVILIIIILIFGIAYSKLPKWGNISESTVFQEKEVRAAAEEIIRLYSDNDYDAVASYVNDDMKNVLSKSTLQYMKEQISTNFGQFKEISDMTFDLAKYDGEQFVLTKTNVLYENVNVTYIIIFDQNMKLSSVQIE